MQLRLETLPVQGFSSDLLGGERIRLSATGPDETVQLADLDGRYWTMETCRSFTGRVAGLHVGEGSVTFTELRYRGSDAGPLPAE